MTTRILKIVDKKYLCFFIIKISLNYFYFSQENTKHVAFYEKKSNFNMRLTEMNSKNKIINNGELYNFT
ncbi:MAG: hypothetical protein Q8776_02550, partial [Sweet potato little leaf phytoplasma]|nr:hypothetical protein [Sweet potato little leaf phytoplasma]